MEILLGSTCLKAEGRRKPQWSGSGFESEKTAYNPRNLPLFQQLQLLVNLIVNNFLNKEHFA